jgi:hypothetical protein
MENNDGGKPVIERDFESDNTFRLGDGLLIRKTRLIICLFGFMTRRNVGDGQTAVTHHWHRQKNHHQE